MRRPASRPPIFPGQRETHRSRKDRRLHQQPTLSSLSSLVLLCFRLFERFFRADTTGVEGTGLGLTM